MKGKLPYIAPEQLRESGVDRRTDIYSLGAVMYEALTDRWLVDANDSEAAIRDILEGRFARPRDLNPEIPEPLEAIVLRALSLDPSARYPTAPAMRQELERYALSKGYLLSSTDLADFLEAMCSGSEEWRAAGILRSTEPAAHSSSVPVEGALAPFNALLGAELRKIDTSDAYSVFTTGEVSGILGASAGTSSVAAPPERKRRLGGFLAAAALLVLLVFVLWPTEQVETVAPTPDVPAPAPIAQVATAPDIPLAREPEAPEAELAPSQSATAAPNGWPPSCGRR